jgi:hypothetical protein
LVGVYILSLLSKKLGHSVGLYRDDGLAAVRATPRQADNIRKDICNIFKDLDLKITIETNMKSVNYLDVTMNLATGKYQPYKKPGNTPLYVHAKSNHPPSILRNIPKNINKRLSNISSDQETFDKVAHTYQEALQKSGYQYTLEYTKPNQQSTKRNRRRNINWYNPPYSKNVQTNIGRKFLNIIRRNFHSKHPLTKIFNTNTIKLSYSCMSNIKNIISSSNKRKITTTLHTAPPNPSKNCNCRRKNECPLQGNCLTKNVVYQASVNSEAGTETYIGLTANSFKTRYNNHKATFRSSHLRNSTALSKHVWELLDNNTNFNISWKIIRSADAFNNQGTRCNLCITEKLNIIYNSHMASLNKRSELMSCCRHKAKYLLCNAIT